MEFLRRKCVCCRTLKQVSQYKGNLKSCILCLEKAKVKYREDTETVLRRCKFYRDNNVEKEKERHNLYCLNNKDEINIKKREYNYLEYYCPVCLYEIILSIVMSRSRYVF